MDLHWQKFHLPNLWPEWATNGVKHDADHLPDPRRLIAACIAPMDTDLALAGFRIIPLSDRASSIAAFRAYWPGASSTNSPRSPARRPSFWRTSSGIVICPLLLSVAVAILSFLVACRSSLLQRGAARPRCMIRRGAGLYRCLRCSDLSAGNCQ